MMAGGRVWWEGMHGRGMHGKGGMRASETATEAGGIGSCLG